MVKVKDETGMETSTSVASSVPIPGRKSRHYQNHTHHHPPFHHFHHYHHWTYPVESAVDGTNGAAAAGNVAAAAAAAANGSSAPTPATIHFGPGFELPQQAPTRYGAGPSGAQGNPNPEHVVHFHVNPGVTISFQIGDNMEVIRGPVTVPMVSTNSSPPIAMPVQVPPGHVVQQIVDESGTLRHVILSPQPQTLVPLQSHNPQHYGGPGNGTSQQQTYYPQGLPPGYAPPPPPHYHSNIPPGHPAHISPLANPGNSPPPNHGYYKDERTQRQYIKLKRKLEAKQLKGDGLGSGQNTPVPSPRKELVNGLRRGAAKEKGMNSVGTSEDGEESSSVQDEEDDVHIITDMLSSVQSPRVSELSSRSALLQWAAPLRLSEASSSDSHEVDVAEADLRYEVLLSDKSKEMKYKSIYSGASLSCRIQDLRPGQEYSVCLQVHLDELQGSASDPIKFTTPACEPDQPQPPKLISRTKTNLQLRWNAVIDNGSHIQYYILEYDDGKDGGFMELHKSRGKQHSLSKLQPATTYKFRLAAVNDCGKSAYSDVVAYATSDNAPQQPNPPCLKVASVRGLHLTWPRRPKDEEFILHMQDQGSGYGYLVVYNGKDTEYMCGNLKRYTEYKFRLRAQNEGGQSGWSEEVTYKTLPDRPSQPARPSVKGRIHAHAFKLKWESPSDKGGAEITTYNLEINCGTGYEIVYTGSETETVCDKLNPGTTYQLRVCCASAGGVSNYSDPCTVTTEAICPGLCALPRLVGKPRSNSMTIKWTGPDYNGGAPVSEYEVEVLQPDAVTKEVAYRGKETEYTITDLLPGQTYVLTVRAVNRIGPGPWSEELKATSGAAPPEQPQTPDAVPKAPFHVNVEWREPLTNGAAVTEYRLEMSTVDNQDNFTPVYTGVYTFHDVKGLTPFTTYYFRVQATNSAGCSPFSAIATTLTPAAPPAAVTGARSEATPTSLTLSWTEPINNGSEITHYNLEIGDKVRTTDGPVLEYTIESLKPETYYKIKIQAVNKVGAGTFSPVVKCSTLPLPPAAPRLECIGVGHNYLKLKWGDGKNSDFTQYCVEMDNTKTKEFQCVYQGTSYTCKVNKLQELSSYRFRISASNDAGEGDYSDIYEFNTCIAPPSSVKTLRIGEVEQRSCSLEWMAAKNNTNDPIVYVVQLTRVRDQDFKQVYKGQETKCTLETLEPGAEYNARVCPIRQTSSGDLPGPYSSHLTFSTVCQEPSSSTKQLLPSSTGSPSRQRRSTNFISWFKPSSTEKKPMTDHQWAWVIIMGLFLLGLAISKYLEPHKPE